MIIPYPYPGPFLQLSLALTTFLTLCGVGVCVCGFDFGAVLLARSSRVVSLRLASFGWPPFSFPGNQPVTSPFHGCLVNHHLPLPI